MATGYLPCMMSVRATLDTYCPAFLLKCKDRVINSPMGYRLARGAFWSLIGSLISRGLGMIAGILVARLLGKHDFGQLGMVQSTIGMFGVFAGFGMGLTANKHIAEFKTANPARAGRIIGISSLVSWFTSAAMAIALFFAAPWLARTTLAAPEMSRLLQVGCLLLLFSGVNGAQTGALAGFEAFKTIARVNLIAGLLAFPITLFCAWRGGVLGSVWALVVNTAVNCLLNFMALREEAAKVGVPLGYQNCFREWPILWRFSLPAVLAGAISGPVGWAANATLVNQPHGYDQMGIFNAVQRIRVVPEMILSLLLAPLLPVLSEKFSNKDIEGFQKAARSAFALSLSITAPVALLQLAAPAITLAPYGQEYAGHLSVVQWIMADLAIMGALAPLTPMVASMNLMWFGLAYNIAYSAVYVGFSLVLIPRYGAIGLSAAITLSRLATLGPCFWYIYSKQKALVCKTSMWQLSSALAVICFLVYLASHWLPVFSAIGISIAFIPLIWLVRRRIPA